MFAIEGLAARYRSETGTEPNLVEGEVSDVSVGSFQSLAEITLLCLTQGMRKTLHTVTKWLVSYSGLRYFNAVSKNEGGGRVNMALVHSFITRPIKQTNNPDPLRGTICR